MSQIFEVLGKGDEAVQHKNQSCLVEVVVSQIFSYVSCLVVFLFTLWRSYSLVHIIIVNSQDAFLSFKSRGREEDAFGFGGFIPLPYMHIDPKSCEVVEDERQDLCELATVLKR